MGIAQFLKCLKSKAFPVKPEAFSASLLEPLCPWHGTLRFQEGHAVEARLLYTQLREFKLKAGCGCSGELCSLVGITIRWFFFSGKICLLSQHAVTRGKKLRAAIYLARETTLNCKVPHTTHLHNASTPEEERVPLDL